VRRDIVIVPSPKKMDFYDDEFCLKQTNIISLPIRDKELVFPIAKRLKELIRSVTKLELPICLGENTEMDQSIVFEYCHSIPVEGYSIEIDENRIAISYFDAAGAFNAVSTIKQIVLQYGKKIPCLFILDQPDFMNRGILIDISRNKIPTMETLFSFIDFMADIKLNQLQLYTEGFSFAYPSFPKAWENGNPVTGEQIIELVYYCRERYIDLVPNQNSLGHMNRWLAKKEFKKLAESPSGYINPYGNHETASTLNPIDPESLELIEKLYNDLLPNFSSDFFNVGLDEPFELGEGKSKEVCDKFGAERIYLDYVLEIYNLVQKQNKTMMFWGDIIIKYPELIKELPRDVLALEWGYEDDHPYDQNCSKYHDAGIPFYVCPGTSSWNSIAGRTDNIYGNLLSAAVNGKKYGAIGFLNTDWGDNGHWQYQMVSYIGYVYGAGLSWNIESNTEMNIGAYLDEFIFMDTSKVTTQIILDLGNYYLLENRKVYNYTVIALVLFSDLHEMKPIEGLDETILNNIEVYIKTIYKRLDYAEMNSKDAKLIDGELRNSARLILHGVKLARLKIILKSQGPSGVSDDIILEMVDEIDEIMTKHWNLWVARNRLEGLEASLKGMRHLKEQYEQYLSIE